MDLFLSKVEWGTGDLFSSTEEDPQGELMGFVRVVELPIRVGSLKGTVEHGGNLPRNLFAFIDGDGAIGPLGHNLYGLPFAAGDRQADEPKPHINQNGLDKFDNSARQSGLAQKASVGGCQRGAAFGVGCFSSSVWQQDLYSF